MVKTLSELSKQFYVYFNSNSELTCEQANFFRALSSLSRYIVTGMRGYYVRFYKEDSFGGMVSNIIRKGMTRFKLYVAKNRFQNAGVATFLSFPHCTFRFP